MNNVTAGDTGVVSVSVGNLIGSVSSQAAAVLVVSGGADVVGQVTYAGTQSGPLRVLLSQRRHGNRALKLDGVGDTIATTIPDLSGAELTIQYWFKGPGPTSVVRQQSGGYVASGWNGLHILSHDRGTTGLSMRENLTDGAWHHVIMTWKQASAGGFASYLDGRLVARRDSATGFIPNHNAQVYIGSLNNSGEFMTGMADEVGIWNRALAAAEIAGGWSLPLTGNESGLIAYWDFNDGTGIDRSPNRHVGDLLGDAVILSEEIPTLGSFYPTVVPTGTSYELRNIPLGENYFVTATSMQTATPFKMRPNPSELIQRMPSPSPEIAPTSISLSAKVRALRVSHPPRARPSAKASNSPCRRGNSDADISVAEK